ncbi:MAG TPA: type II secretion system F family protein [Nitrososphaerales archaeon]
MRDDLLKSGLRVTPVGLVAVALFSAMVSGILAAGVIAWAAFTHHPYFFLAGVAPFAVFLMVLNAPKVSKSSRGSALDNEMPFLVGYLSVLAGGGLSLIETLRQISEIDVFKAAAKEAKRMLIDIDVFGRDPITAMERAAKYSPSREWAELLTGYTTVLRTGGDHVNYLNLRLKETLDKMADKIKRTVETVGLISESFLIVTVVLGMTLFTLYLVEALVNGNSAGVANIYLFSFVVVPTLSASFIWLMDSFSQKWPFTDMRPYKIFLSFVPVGVLLFFLPLPILLYQHMAISLLAISAVPSFFATKYSRERRTIERMLPEFIEDVAEQRKIGLPPEQAIERLGEGNRYGGFSKYVSKMGAQLSWGISLGKVVSGFTKGVSSWVGRAVGTLMLEVVELGGGTLRGFDDMAVFTRRISVSESDARSSLRAFVLIIYIGGIMLTLTTFVMIFMISQQTALAARGIHVAIVGASPRLLDDLLTASVFQSWVLGMVAGKMGEGSLAEGFKHSVALVVITLLSVVVAGFFVPIHL